MWGMYSGPVFRDEYIQGCIQPPQKRWLWGQNGGVSQFLLFFCSWCFHCLKCLLLLQEPSVLWNGHHSAYIILLRRTRTFPTRRSFCDHQQGSPFPWSQSSCFASSPMSDGPPGTVTAIPYLPKAWFHMQVGPLASQVTKCCSSYVWQSIPLRYCPLPYICIAKRATQRYLLEYQSSQF